MSSDGLKKYEVILNGVNYLLDFDEVPKRMGFYVTRYVEAKDPDEAELIAVDKVRNIEHLNRVILNDHDDPPRIFLEEMYEIESFDGIETLEPGIGFYEESN